MGPIQNFQREKLLPTDGAIVMARRMLYEAAAGRPQTAMRCRLLAALGAQHDTPRGLLK